LLSPGGLNQPYQIGYHHSVQLGLKLILSTRYQTWRQPLSSGGYTLRANWAICPRNAGFLHFRIGHRKNAMREYTRFQ
jgi:hypothetical protein